MKTDIILLGGLTAISILMVLSLYFILNYDPDGALFCQSKGYGGVVPLSTYSEKYGKVECASCYKMQCIREEFNVSRSFGRLREVKE